MIDSLDAKAFLRFEGYKLFSATYDPHFKCFWK